MSEDNTTLFIGDRRFTGRAATNILIGIIAAYSFVLVSIGVAIGVNIR